ncbi:hypothetical protein V5O48_012232 [Marasmius crinis-equi]|uniref:Uncharacterized protein n=1 Tax=Marasmius crinis-equi TaxID=585013 RepID=A0ABR3F3Y2_9AGAR
MSIVLELPVVSDMRKSDSDSKIQAQIAPILELIYPHIQSLDFEGTNWAYFVRVSDSDVRLVQKPRPLQKISITPWLPRVREEELEFTRWMDENTYMGTWNSRDVVVHAGLNDRDMYVIETTMKSLVAIRDSGMDDVCFEPLAHLVRDGLIVGIIWEPPNGRMIDVKDRTLVTEFFWRLKEHGLVWRRASSRHNVGMETIDQFYFFDFTGCLMVDKGGKVRFNHVSVMGVQVWTPVPRLEPGWEGYLPNQMAINATFYRLESAGMNQAVPPQFSSLTPLSLTPVVPLIRLLIMDDEKRRRAKSAKSTIIQALV